MTKKFKTEILKTRQFRDSKQTTMKVTTNKKYFKVSDIHGLLKQFESVTAEQNIQTMVRVPTILGPRTVKMFSGDLQLEEYEDYLRDKVAEVGKFNKITYLEITVLKQI
jgi:hypothetical protein